MNITLPLEAQEEARLLAAARARGISASDLVREAVRKIISEGPPEATAKREPTGSVRGLLAEYGRAPSAEEIDECRAGMLKNFPRDGF